MLLAPELALRDRDDTHQRAGEPPAGAAQRGRRRHRFLMRPSGRSGPAGYGTLTGVSIAHAAVDDAELIARARDGDVEATAALLERHRAAAYRYARVLTDAATAEDLVSEAVAKVLERLRSGGGPDQALRPYLLTAVRNCHVDLVRRERRLVLVDDDDVHEPGAVSAVGPHAPGIPGSEGAVEAEVVLQAMRSLPERWQLVLWHTEVESEDHRTVGQLLGIKANAVAALASRAREGLRRAYLAAHVAAAADGTCRATREQLPAFVRGRLGVRDAASVERHLAHCSGCEGCRRELVLLNNRVGAVLAPAVLGTAGSSYMTGVPGAAAGLAQPGHLARWAGRATSRTAAIVAGALAAVAAGGVLALQSGPGPDRAVAEPAPAAPSSNGATAPMSPLPAEHSPSGARVGRDATGPLRVGTSAVGTHPVLPVAPSTEPNPSASSTTQNPLAIPSAGPGAPPGTAPGGSPSELPSAPAEPTDTPLPPGWTEEDLRVAGAHAADFGSHFHLELEVRSTSPGAVLTVELTGADFRGMHAGGPYLPAACAADRADPTVVRCPIGAASGPVGIDLIATGDAFRGIAIVASDRNRDPVAANDRVVVTLR